MHNLNQTIFYFLNGFAGRYSALDASVLFATHYIPYAMVVIVLLYMLLVYKQHEQTITSTMSRMVQAIEFAGSLFLTWVLVSCVKVIIAHPRPFLVLARTIALIPDQGGYSFPSMHAALTTALATTVYMHHRRLGVFLYLFAFIVGLSRVYAGVHYPVDVVVGMLFGAGIAFGIHRLFDRNRAL